MIGVEFVGIAGFVVAALSFVAGSFFLGGRRWRSNYDAEHTRAERLQATLIEKDLLMAGMSERLARLDEVVQELGGQKVYQEMIAMQERNLALFQDITHAIKNGDEQITRAIENLTHTVEKIGNGEGGR